MRHLRMLTNAIVGGALLSGYVLILILHLNPSLPLDALRLAPLAGRVLLFFGVHTTVLFYLLIVLRQLLAAETLSPGWLSVRLLTWISAAAAGLGSIAFWMNLGGFAAVLEPASSVRMATAATVLGVCAVSSLILALYGMTSRQRHAWSLVLFALTLVASLVVPLAVRGRGTEEVLHATRLHARTHVGSDPGLPRIVMLLVDGASLDFISPAAAEGRLPNFGRILDGGAVMHLATLRPTQPETVWSAVATGKLPFKNGIRSAATYGAGGPLRIDLLPDFCFAHGLVHFGLLDETPHAAVDLRAQPLWSILGGLGISSGVVNWTLTHPALPVRGFLVSDQFHQQRGSGLELGDGLVYPHEALMEVSAAAARPVSAAAPKALVSVTVTSAESDLSSVTEVPFAIDSQYEQIAFTLQEARPAQLLTLRYQGLDAAGHYFLRFAVPRAFGDVSDTERALYGRVLEQYYTFIDAAVGRAMATLGPGDLLVVVSPFGMEPLSVGKRLLERAFGNPRLSGSHEAAPDGFLLAYGSAVDPRRLTRASVLDVAPTVLYFLGLPVARDMDGYARPDVFTRDFTAERPITFIPSYEQ